MWIMEKRGGHCPSLEATNSVLGKDRELYASASHICTRNEKISSWTDLVITSLLFKATVLHLASLFSGFGKKISKDFHTSSRTIYLGMMQSPLLVVSLWVTVSSDL